MNDDRTLRSALIRLAAENPALRPQLLPLLKEAAPVAITPRDATNALDGCIGKLAEVGETLEELAVKLAAIGVAGASAVDRANGEANALHGRLEQLRRGFEKGFVT